MAAREDSHTAERWSCFGLCLVEDTRMEELEDVRTCLAGEDTRHGVNKSIFLLDSSVDQAWGSRWNELGNLQAAAGVGLRGHGLDEATARHVKLLEMMQRSTNRLV